MDWIVTPERTVRTDAVGGKPTGIEWGAFDERRLDGTSILSRPISE